MYDIDKNVPMPEMHPKTSSVGRIPKYPFGSMEVGDSFEVPEDKGRNMKAAASVYGIRNGKRFKVATNPDRSVRCWRVE